MRPGCIFVSHRSILIWLIYCFLCFCKYCRRVWVSVSSFVIFWTLFNFPKSYVCHVLARHFLLVVCIWCVEGLSFSTPSDALLEGGERWLHQLNDFVGFCVRWAAWRLSAVQWRREHRFLSSTRSLVLAAFSHQLRLSSVSLFSSCSFDCYQLAESTFSTCAIQRYFSTSVYSFWGFWCTFFMICVILFWWWMGTRVHL